MHNYYDYSYTLRRYNCSKGTEVLHCTSVIFSAIFGLNFKSIPLLPSTMVGNQFCRARR